MNQDNLKDTIKAILEYSEITSCETKIDFEGNIIKLDFSAVVKELTPYHKLRRSISDVLGRGIFDMDREFLTSGYTPFEKERMRASAERYHINRSKNDMVEMEKEDPEEPGSRSPLPNQRPSGSIR